MELRPYQQEAVDNTLAEFEQNQAVLAVMATGLGKTVYFCHVAKAFLKRGKVLIIAHREELIFQAKDKVKRILGIEPEIEMAGQWANCGIWSGEVIISTVQTQISGMEGNGRMSRFDPHQFALLIIDEAHHAVAPSYRKVIEHFKQNPNLKILGVTATPDRADELALGRIFQSVAYDYDIRDGIEDGWLVPITQLMIDVDTLDFSNVRTTAGDLNGKDLAEQMEYEANLWGVAEPTFKEADGRKTLVFAASVAHAERLAEIFNRMKPNCAEWVCGTTPKEYRRKIFDAYARRELQFLVNVGVATEGFDDPSIEVVAMARPTKSRCLYTQMCGRGTRPLPGVVEGLADAYSRKAAIEQSAKKNVMIIDFVGNSGRHKLVCSADILGGKYEDEVIELAKRACRRGKPVEMMSELKKAEAEIAARRKRREEAERRNLIQMTVSYKKKTVDPFDVFDITPQRERAWNKNHLATFKQREFLAKWGIDAEGMTRQQASQLITECLHRREKQLCTFKQAAILKKKGIKNAHLLTFKQASQLIEELKKNNWRWVKPIKVEAAV